MSGEENEPRDHRDEPRLFDENKRWDGEDRYVGFRSELFGGLETDVELHLTDREVHRVGIDPDVDIFVRKGRKDPGEVSLLMKLRGEGHISFEEWLERKGIDLRDLPGTMYGLLPADFLEEESLSPWGKAHQYGDVGRTLCDGSTPGARTATGGWRI